MHAQLPACIAGKHSFDRWLSCRLSAPQEGASSSSSSCDLIYTAPELLGLPAGKTISTASGTDQLWPHSPQQCPAMPGITCLAACDAVHSLDV